MTKASEATLNRIYKFGLLTKQDNNDLWDAYKDIFGAYPEGTKDCLMCVTESFWKAFNHIKLGNK